MTIRSELDLPEINRYLVARDVQVYALTPNRVSLEEIFIETLGKEQRTMKNIWIIARMTFREATRRRIVLTGLVLGLVFLTVFTIGFRMVFINASIVGNRSAK